MTLIGDLWPVVGVSREAVQPLHILTGSSAGRAVKGTSTSRAIRLAHGGAGGIRTRYLLTASQALSQLSYSPS